jgi:hypothetical protein
MPASLGCLDTTFSNSRRHNTTCAVRSNDAVDNNVAMTSDGSGDGPSITSPGLTSREVGPYVLRTLLDEVPLSADGSKDDIKINCVDYLGK